MDTLVLCYHAVSETFPATLSVTPDALHDQLHHLRTRGYRGVTFTEAAAKDQTGKRVAVTFDDAFASVEELGKPILDALGWPATIFAVSDFAADGRPIAWDGTDQWAATEHAPEMRSLDWTRLKALQDKGWEIGSHTATHPHLTRVDDETLDRELTSSRAAVQEALQIEDPSLAYPYGDVDARVVDAARRAGYTYAAALPARWTHESPLDYPRAGIYHGDDLRRFRLKASPWVRNLRRVLAR
jgi:peptidoglycan/xylan/chitin deacetylase (PgdA/CDA1 family)